MLELQNRQKFKKRFFSKPVFLIVLILTVLMVKATINLYIKKLHSSRDLAAVSESVNTMRAREQELNIEIEKLGTQRGVEEEIRKKYSVVKSGEEMVVLVDEKTPPSDNNEVSEGFFARTWHKITNLFKDPREASSTTPEN